MLEPIEQLVLDLLTKGVKIAQNDAQIVFAEHKAKKNGHIGERYASLHIYPLRKEVKIVGPKDKMKEYDIVEWIHRKPHKNVGHILSEIEIERGKSPIIELLMKRFWA